jgi:hypothetical protein
MESLLRAPDGRATVVTGTDASLYNNDNNHHHHDDDAPKVATDPHGQDAATTV